jgi:hypothetical protein
MALTQQQRIEISKKVISISKEIKTAQSAKATLANTELPRAIDIDSANKSIIDLRKPVIDGYQAELSMLDGNGRTVLVEKDYVDAANRTVGNYFFYNQLSVPTTSAPTGQWINLDPLLLGFGIGKNYNEVFNIAQKEQDLINAFNAAVAALEAFHPMERCTGQKAITSSTPPAPPSDMVVTYPEAQSALATLNSAVDNYNSFLISQSNIIYTSDFVLSRQMQANNAKNYIENIIKPAVSLWLGYNNFNTAHGQTTVSGFYGYDTALLQPTRGNPIQLNILKQAIIDRKSFVDNTRIPQLVSHLGSVSQDVDAGKLLSYSGLYGERALAISMRLNSMTGSLSRVESIKRGFNAQENTIQASEIASVGYDLLIKVSKFKAPANDTNVIHVHDTSSFVGGDLVFVCGDGQAEISGTIISVEGTRVDLDVKIPRKYTALNNSRIYKTT